MKTKILETEQCRLFICECEPQDELDHLTWRIQKSQEIDGVIDPGGDIENGLWNYDCRNLISAATFFRKPTNREQVTGFLEQIAEIMPEAEHYLIPEDHLLLQLDSIFMDEADETVYMICVPIAGMHNSAKELVLELTQQLQPEEGRTNHYLDRMRSFAYEQGPDGSEGLRQLLGEIAQLKEEAVQPPVMNVQPQVTNVQPQVGNIQPQVMNIQPQVMNIQPQVENVQPQVTNVQPQVENVQPQVTNVQPQVMEAQPHLPEGWRPSSDDTVVLTPDMLMADEELQTVVWNNMRGMLTRYRTGENFLLEKTEMRIGQDPSSVDICISGNPTISRRHAVIVNHQDHYFLSDNHSTNHTYVNGRMLSEGEEVELARGDIIRLSDEDFIFKIV